jgi:hypothetical protein
MFIRNSNDVQSHSLEIQQITVTQKMKTASNYYSKRFIKCGQIAEFTDYYGMIFAALIESNSNYISFTPRPFRLKVLGRPYIPDFCLVGNGDREIIDIVNGFANEKIDKVLTNFFNNNGFKYSVITTDSLKAEQQKAESWLQVVSLLVTTKDFNSHYEEDVILNGISSGEIENLGDIVDSGDRNGTLASEIALFRLMHGGFVIANLDNSPLSYNTELSSC